MLEPWFVWSVSLPSCSSQFIHTQMWDHPVHQPPPPLVLQPPPCHVSSLLGCPSLPFLPVWMNVSSLTPWLLDFHIVQFPSSSGYFLFLNLLSFFWLSKVAKYIYQDASILASGCTCLFNLLFWVSSDKYPEVELSLDI